MKNTLNIFGVILLLISTHLCSYAQNEKDTLKVLFVGNSYIYSKNLPQIVSLISDNSDTKLLTSKSTKGGATLKQHWLGEKGLKTKELIENEKFDIIVLQEQSMGTIIEPDSMLKYSAMLCDLIKENGAKPFLFQTWARKKVPQFQEEISYVYSKAAKSSGATIIPVGDAWELAMQLRPNIELYRTDGSHPSELGTFLTACVFVSTILGDVPDDIKSAFRITDLNGESVQLMKIDGLDIVFSRKITEEIKK